MCIRDSHGILLLGTPMNVSSLIFFHPEFRKSTAHFLAGLVGGHVADVKGHEVLLHVHPGSLEGMSEHLVLHVRRTRGHDDLALALEVIRKEPVPILLT